MSLPSKEETCAHAIGVLEDVLRSDELLAVSRETFFTPAAGTSPASKFEQALVAHSRSVVESADVLLGQLGRGGGGGTKASPHILDFPLFAKKSRLLHERLRRVKVAFRSLKHVGLLSEESAGRRVIIDRAYVSVKELLDTIMALSATVAASSPSLACATQDTFQQDEEMCKRRENFDGLAVSYNKEPSGHSLVNVASAEKQNGFYSERGTLREESHKQPLKDFSASNAKLSTDTYSTCIIAAVKPLVTRENNKEDKCAKEIKKNTSVEKRSDRHISVEKEITEFNKQQEKPLVSSFMREERAHFFHTNSFADVNSAGQSSPSAMHRFDHGTLLATQHNEAMEVGGGPADFSEKKLAVNSVSPEHFSTSNNNSSTLEANFGSCNTAVDISFRKESNVWPQSTTTVSLQKRLFCGRNWRKFLREEGAIVHEWKKDFISEIALLFGIPNEWVSDVHVSDVSPVNMLTDGDQEVTFKVRLPSFFEDNEIKKRIQQHEFMKLVLLYEKFEENAKEATKRKEEKIEKEPPDLCVLPNGSNDNFLRVPGTEQATLFDAVTGKVGEKNDDGSLNIAEENKSSDLANRYSFATVGEDVQARGTPRTEETQRKEPLVKAAVDNQQVIEGQSHDAEAVSDADFFLSLQEERRDKQLEAQSEEEERTMRGVDPMSISEVPPPRCFAKLPPPVVKLFPREHSGNAQRSSLARFSGFPETEVGVAATGETGEDCAANDTLLPHHSKAPRFSLQRTAGDLSRAAEASVQLLSTMHKKVLFGEGWDIVVCTKEEELRRTFTKEVAALFELPEENVKQLEFALGSLVVTFELLHDRYLQEKEINALLAVFDFPMVRNLYKSSLGNGANTTAAQRFSDDKVLVNEKKSVGSVDNQVSSLLPADDANNRAPSHTEYDSEMSPKATFTVSQQQTPSKQQQLSCLREFSVTLARDDTATPDNEPITFAHLALVHDLPVEQLVQANPHLAAFGVNDVLPPAAHVTVPRFAFDDFSCFLRESSDEPNSGHVTPSAHGSSFSRFHTPRDSESLRSNYLMNLKDLARRLGVSIDALRQRNTHLNTYGDVDPLPKNCLVVVPAQFFAASESPSVVSSLCGGSPFSSHALTHRDQPFAATVCSATRGADRRTPVVPFKKVVREPSALKLVYDNETTIGDVSPAKVAAVVGDSKSTQLLRQPVELLELSQDATHQSSEKPLTNVSCASEKHSCSFTRSCSAALNGSVRRDNAVLLMTRSIQQFLLLRFFAKWRYNAQMRRETRATANTYNAGVVVMCGADAGLTKKKDSCDGIKIFDNETRGLSQRRAGSSRSSTLGSNRRGYGERPVWASGGELRSCSGSWCVNSNSKSVSREPFSGFFEPRLQQRRARSCTTAAVPRHKNYDTEQNAGHLFKGSLSEGPLSSQASCSRSGTPRLSFSRASSPFLGSFSYSLDQKPTTGGDFSTPDQYFLGLCISASLVVTEVCGEAADAGICRGDEVQEVEGGRVATLKGLRKALNCVVGPCVRLTVLQKTSGLLRTFTLWRTADHGERYKSLSRSSSPGEPKITPLLSAAKKNAVHSSNVYGDKLSLSCVKPRICGISKLLGGAQGRRNTQKQLQK